MQVRDWADIIGAILTIALVASILEDSKVTSAINTVGSLFSGALKTVKGG